MGTNAACTNIVYVIEDGTCITAKNARVALLYTGTTTDIKGLEACIIDAKEFTYHNTGDAAKTPGCFDADLLYDIANPSHFDTVVDPKAGDDTPPDDGESDTKAADT